MGEKAGTSFPVEVPSTISVLTQFEGGQTGTSLLSFDSPLARQGIVEIHGTEGSLVVPVVGVRKSVLYAVVQPCCAAASVAVALSAGKGDGASGTRKT